MLLKFSEFQSTGVPDALAKSKSPWLNSWLFDFLLDEGIPFQWLRFASMKLIQSNSRGSNNLLSNQLPSKLLTFPLANNSSWVPVSTHSPALNTTLEKHVKNIQLWPCMLIYTYIHLYMLTYIYIYIHYSLFVVSPFWQKKTSSQLCQVIKSTCIYLISAIFEAYQNDNLEIEIIKLMYQLNNTVKMKLCKKRQSDQFLQQMCFKGFKVSSPMVIHIGHLQSWYNQICILHGG